jgi:hypothetical protein
MLESGNPARRLDSLFLSSRFNPKFALGSSEQRGRGVKIVRKVKELQCGSQTAGTGTPGDKSEGVASKDAFKGQPPFKTAALCNPFNGGTF